MMSGRNRVKLAGMILFICLNSVFARDIVEIEAAGLGGDREAAIEQAKRSAVERAIGVVIGGESLVRNYTLVYDRIISRTYGYVQSFDLLREEEQLDGLVRVVIRARVGEILDQILEDKLAMELLISWLEKPRVMVLIAEDNVGDKSSNVAETTIAGALIENGFTVVDRDVLGAQGNPFALVNRFRETGGDIPAELASLDVQLVLAGRATASEGETPEVMRKAGMVSVQADISARLYRTDNGEVLATHNEHGARAHINPTSAGTGALKEAAAGVHAKLLADVVTLWSLRQANTVPVEVEVHGLSFSRREALIASLEEVAGVTGVFERGFMNGIQRCMVEFEGRATDLAGLIDGLTLGDASWNVTLLSGGKIVLSPRKDR